MDPQRDPSSVNIPSKTAPSSTSSRSSNTVQDQSALITSPPELRLRNAAPEPQNGATDCSSAAQSASQAIQQATQQASQSIQQAQQSASQAIQQATQQANQSVQSAQQSASQAIQQVTIQASNSLAAASRSVTSIMSSASAAVAGAQSSASAAIASAQSSASREISLANGSMFSAQASASTAESVLRAAVAAATGSAAAAGSSFLAAAAKATQGAQASVSAIGAAATSQIAQASQQASVSQTVAITATEAAIAIVGSIIASTLITILIYFLVIRHKKLVRRRSKNLRALEYPNDPKLSPTLAGSPTDIHDNRSGSNTNSEASAPSSVQRTVNGSEPRTSVVKTTTVKWNPSKPPKAPTLASWLTLQESVSPFGPINLPDVSTPVPLGGQLKSPLQSTYPVQQQISKPPPRSNSIKPFTNIEPKFNALKKQPSVASKVAVTAVRPTIAVIAPKPEFGSRTQITANRESKESIWTDQSVEDDSTPIPQSNQARVKTQPPMSITKSSGMRLPEPVNNVRNTAEWLASPSRFAPEVNASQTLNTNTSMRRSAGQSYTLPENIGGTIGKAR